MTPQANTLTAEQSSTQTTPEPGTLQNFIGGSWVSAKASDALDVTNPANGEVIARVPLSTRADVDAAAAAASAAWPDWRSRAVGERTEFIYALREQFRQRITEIADSITREGGKVT